MSNQAKDRKISNFLKGTAIPSNAYLTYVDGKTNKKILLSDFLNSIGVSGSIEQAGNVLATPVLNKSGSVNEIRNLEDGSGVKTSISAENGITVEHNFIEDTSGVELVVDLAAIQPKFRSIIGASGINVSASNGQIQIALSDIPATTKTVIVNDINDFPAASGDVITLENDTEYAIRNDITTSNRFVVGTNTVVAGSDSITINFTYTGSDTMFTSNGSSWTLKNITATCSGGTFIDFNGTGTEIYQLKNSVVVCDTTGTIGGFAGIHFDDTQFQITTNGLTFLGSNGVVLIESALGSIEAGTFFDLGSSTFSGFSITDGFYTLNGSSVYLDGAASSANINSGGLGTIHNCRFFGTGAPLQTIVDDDIRWQFFINDDIDDTHRDCMMSQIGNVTATTINVAGTPEKLAGTWLEEHASHFTTDTTGRMTYIGVKDEHLDLTFSFTAAPVSGTNKDIVFYAFKNGVEISNSAAANNLSAGDPGRTTLLWRDDFTEGDYIEAYVENNTDTVNVLVTDAILRIS